MFHYMDYTLKRGYKNNSINLGHIPTFTTIDFHTSMYDYHIPRKMLNKGVLLWIHLNLSLSLLLVLILFVGGMETATTIEVRAQVVHSNSIHIFMSHLQWLCTVVAAMLHYLFLCVFCWMLVEGIVLYLLVVRVFGNAARKWYYLLPIGWGKEITTYTIPVKNMMN